MARTRRDTFWKTKPDEHDHVFLNTPITCVFIVLLRDGTTELSQPSSNLGAWLMRKPQDIRKQSFDMNAFCDATVFDQNLLETPLWQACEGRFCRSVNLVADNLKQTDVEKLNPKFW